MAADEKAPRRSGPSKWIALAVCVFIALLAGIGIAAQVSELTAATATTTGTVAFVKNPGSYKYCSADVEYAVGGKVYHASLDCHGSMHFGDPVQVKYDPDDPTVTANDSSAGSVALLAVIGLGMPVAWLVVWVRRRRRQHRTASSAGPSS